MLEAVQQCTRCGAGLKLDDLRRPDCPYCNTVYPHQSQAAQAAQMNAMMMGQMMQQAAATQDQWRAAYGAPPLGGGPPGGPPPGMPMGGPGMPPGVPGMYGVGSPYGDPRLIAQAHMAHVNATGKAITKIVIGVIVASFVLTIGIAVLMIVVR